jgi:hypothetical protein
MKNKKGLWLTVPLLALMVASMVLLPRTAHGNNAAVVINDWGCALFDGNGNVVFTDISHAVINNNGNGLVTCRVTTNPNSDGKEVRWTFANTGAECSFDVLAPTTDFHETVSPSGQAELSCHFRQ